MSAIYDETAMKKATNVTINSDLLQKAKSYKINISQTFEKHLTEVVKKKKEQEWLEENRKAIEAYNTRVERDGLFSDSFRRF